MATAQLDCRASGKVRLKPAEADWKGSCFAREMEFIPLPQ